MYRNFLFMLVLFSVSCKSPIEEDSINIGFMGELITLDPDMRSEATTVSINSNIFESLVKFDPNMAIQQELAKGWENPDVRTWIFHLREGVLFHNGDTLTADDVRFSILRARDHPKSELKGNLLKVSNVEIIDNRTIKIITIKPDFPFLNKLASIPILSKKYTTGRDMKFLSSYPVGTGPYRFLELKKGEYVRLKSDKNYWGKLPEIQDVTFVFYNKLYKAIEELLTGKIDMMIESLERIDSPNERLKMMQKIMASVMDEVPSIPLFASEDLYAKRKNIVWKPRMDGTILVSEIFMEDKRK